MGAIWAFQEAGLRVPEDVSIVGFDDVALAACSSPALTTIRQPLELMGQIAAKTLIDRIENKAEYQSEIVVKPELIVRSSTCPPPKSRSARITSVPAREMVRMKQRRPIQQPLAVGSRPNQIREHGKG